MTEKKESYYILNPFNNKSLEESIEKIDMREVIKENEFLKDNFNNEEKNKLKDAELDRVVDIENNFNISENETDGVKDLTGEKRELPSGIIKEKTVSGIIYKINKKWSINNRLKIVGLSLVWILLISSINIREVFALKIIGSGVIGFLLARIWMLQKDIEIKIEDKKIKVGELELPLNVIKSIAIGQGKEINLEKEMSFALRSDSLINESFNQEYINNDLEKGNGYKLIVNIEDNDYVLAKGLNEKQANDILNELSN